MDPISLAVGAGILAVGFLAGYVSGRVAAARRRPPPPPEPICGCGHHRSMHSSGGKGACNVAVGTRRKYSDRGADLGPRPVGCACQQYVGPEPITSLWTPPIAAEGSER